MTKSEDPNAAEKATKAPNTMLTMILTMADTTWRMFVPTLGLLVLGIYIDKAIGAFPWFTGLGFIIGVGLSALLVRNQLKKDSS